MSATDKAAILSSEYATSFIAGVVSEKPLLVIRPSTSRASLNLQEVWQSRAPVFFDLARH